MEVAVTDVANLFFGGLLSDMILHFDQHSLRVRLCTPATPALYLRAKSTHASHAITEMQQSVKQ